MMVYYHPEGHLMPLCPYKPSLSTGFHTADWEMHSSTNVWLSSYFRVFFLSHLRLLQPECVTNLFCKLAPHGQPHGHVQTNRMPRANVYWAWLSTEQLHLNEAGGFSQEFCNIRIVVLVDISCLYSFRVRYRIAFRSSWSGPCWPSSPHLDYWHGVGGSEEGRKIQVEKDRKTKETLNACRCPQAHLSKSYLPVPQPCDCSETELSGNHQGKMRTGWMYWNPV